MRFALLLSFLFLGTVRANSQILTFTDIKNAVISKTIQESNPSNVDIVDWSAFHKILLEKGFIYVGGEQNPKREIWAYQYDNKTQSAEIITYLQTEYGGIKAIILNFGNQTNTYEYLDSKIKQYCKFIEVQKFGTSEDAVFMRKYLHSDGTNFLLWHDKKTDLDCIWVEKKLPNQNIKMDTLTLQQLLRQFENQWK